MIARNVVIESSPLPRERSRSGSISGMMPYLAGLKNVDCSAIRNNTASIAGKLCQTKATTARLIATISRAEVAISTVRLLQTSARCPAYPENRKNGRMNTPCASEA
jgi:hypothetical protein